MVNYIGKGFCARVLEESFLVMRRFVDQHSWISLVVLVQLFRKTIESKLNVMLTHPIQLRISRLLRHSLISRLWNRHWLARDLVLNRAPVRRLIKIELDLRLGFGIAVFRLVKLCCFRILLFLRWKNLGISSEIDHLFGLNFLFFQWTRLFFSERMLFYLHQFWLRLLFMWSPRRWY